MPCDLHGISRKLARPERFRTPDPQIRSLLLNQGSPLLCSSRRAARMEPHRDGGPAAPMIASGASILGVRCSGGKAISYSPYSVSLEEAALSSASLLPRRYSLYAGRRECFRSVQIARSADPFAPSAELIAFRPV